MASSVDFSKMTELELQSAEVPWPRTLDELNEIIESVTKREQDYGTCVYAMSIAATAAMRYVSSQLGVTGFQASAADLDIIRRSRGLKHGFAIVDFGHALYPQYMKDEYWWSADRVLTEQKQELADAARVLIDESGEHTSPTVRGHWNWLAARSAPTSRASGAERVEGEGA